jgi:hypothetical protein
VSGELEGAELDLHGVTDAAAPPVGVPAERELLALADAVVGGDEAALAEARHAALAVLGPESFVSAAAVASNFERMVRIADGTGIPLDPPLAAISADIRADLGIDGFGSAANTPAVPAAARWLGRAAAPLARYALPVFARLARGAGRPKQGR